MRIVFLGNNVNGVNILKWLMHQSAEIVGLVVHPPEKARCVEEIIDVSQIKPHYIFRGNEINEANTIEKIYSLKPDLFLSVNFDYILKKEAIQIPAKGCINIHTSFLPYNRGYYPNVWSIIEEAPAGVTIHYMDEGIDTGDVIAQREVPVDFTDTGETLYRKLEEASLVLFKETWPKIKSDTHKGVKQSQKGTFHGKRDVEKIDRIDLNQNYRAKDLINVLRARTFPPYEGAFVEVNGVKIFLELTLRKQIE